MLCDQADETTDHLFAACPFSREVWARLLAPLALQHLAPDGGSSLVDWWLTARQLPPVDLRRAFDSLVLLVAWVIWKERNRRTFDNISMTTTQVIAAVKEELDAYTTAGFRCLALLFAVAT